MLVAVFVIPIYIFGFIAMFYMESLCKALLFLVLMVIATFIMYVFVAYSFESALFVSSLMLMSTLKVKD